MKLLPMPLPGLNGQPIGAPLGMWGPELLWRYQQAPPSPLSELKSQLPAQLSPDPRVWNRDDVAVFLQFCEREFDLPKFDLDAFQMNGKALCLLGKADLAERVPGAGDVLHNVLQMLIRESQSLHKHLPTSPVTPTSRYPFSPHSQPPTPNWSMLAPPDSPFHTAHFQQLMAQSQNSVTLSPAPSTDSSQGRSPPTHQNELLMQQQQAQQQQAAQQQAHQQAQQQAAHQQQQAALAAGFAASVHQHHQQSQHHQQQLHMHMQQKQQQQQHNSQSDSDEDSSFSDKTSSASSATMMHQQQQSHHHQQHHQHHQPPSANGSMPMQHDQLLPSSVASVSPPPTPLSKDAPLSLTQQITNVVNSWSVCKSENGATNGVAVNGSSSTASCVSSNSSSSSSNGSSSTSSSAPSTPSYLSVKREFFSDSASAAEPNTNGRLLWDFLQQLLNDNGQRYSNFIAWKCRDTGVFKIVDPAGLAKLWGIQKNHLSMNYDKMSRALRYYYRVNILRKVQGERHCYQFLRNPTELKSIKNISLLRQSNPSPAASAGPASASNGSIKPDSPMHSLHNAQSSPAGSNPSAVSSGAPTSSSGHPIPHPLQLHQLANAAAVAAAAAAINGSPSHHHHAGLTAHPLPLPLTLSPRPPMSPPPSSPRVLSLNGAFHHLSTSSPVVPHAPMQFPPVSMASGGESASPRSPTPTGAQQHHHMAYAAAVHHHSMQHQLAISAAAAAAGGNSSHSRPPSEADSDDFKMEPNIDVEEDDDLPTDLSVGPAKYQAPSGSPNAGNASPASSMGNDCYPLISNANGLTTIRLVTQSPQPPPSTQSAESADAPSNGHEHAQQKQPAGDDGDDDVSMATDLCK